MPPGTTRKHKVFVPLLLGPRLSARAEKIKWAWPDLHYHTVTAAIVLSPRRIAPSQLRLVEITYLALRIWLKQQRADADQ